MKKLIAIAATGVLLATPALADNTFGKTISDTFKGGPNSAHGMSYGKINKMINDTIRETGSYTSVHTGTEYTKPGAGNRK